MVGYSDNVLTARSFAARKGQDVDGNTELVALGAGNLLAGLIRGFPVSSSGSRTAIGDAQGSRTQLHSLVAVVVVVLILAFGQAVLASFPTAALGAVVIFAALRLIDVAEFRRIARFRRSELGIALPPRSPCSCSGCCTACSRPSPCRSSSCCAGWPARTTPCSGWCRAWPACTTSTTTRTRRPIPGLVVYRYDAPLCFANAEDFRRSALAAAAGAGPEPARWFVLNAEANVEIDITAADALHALITELRRRGIVFAMARVKQDLRDVLVRAGLVELIGEERMYMTLPTAVAAYREWVAAES